MDPLVITNIVIGLIGLAIGHFHVLPFLPAPTPKAPALPTSVGHGEILRYLEQLLINAIQKAPPTPVPVGPSNIDVTALLQQLLALIEKQIPPQPQPTLPSAPK